MSNEKKPEQPDWRRSASGLYVPQGVPDGGKKPPVGFGRALEQKPKRDGT